jgi:hypothetical protein
MKNFAAGLKNMHSHRIARLLVDVEAAIKEEDVVSVEFPAGTKKAKDASIPEDEESEEQGAEKQSNASGAPGDANAATNDEEEDDEEPIVQLAEDSEETEDDDDMAEAANQFQVLKHISQRGVPQTVEILEPPLASRAVNEQGAVNSPSRSLHSLSPPRGISEEAWRNAPYTPSFELCSQDFDARRNLRVMRMPKSPEINPEDANKRDVPPSDCCTAVPDAQDKISVTDKVTTPLPILVIPQEADDETQAPVTPHQQQNNTG